MSASDACVVAMWDIPTPARKAWPAGLRARVLCRASNPYGAGHCWHCGVSLLGGGTRWHIDHWPIPWRDIHDQLCCGVTDEHDERNLVPSCMPCNLSHRHEPPPRQRYCGRTQPCCLRSAFRRAAWATAGAGVGLLLGAAVAAAAFM